MFRPSDLQLVLLYAAATRADGSLLPPPESIGGQAVRIRQSIGPLLSAGYVVEKLVADPSAAWRSKAGRPYGVFISEAGRVAVGATPAGVAPVSIEGRAALLLRRGGGFAIGDLVEVLGARASIVRDVLTDMKRAGVDVRARYVGGQTCYRIVA